ncbi:DMT family transporter [Halalkalibacter akibai]|uniref:Permease of the drug/metabolite transporter n=1 Tax=Halalkalibacter akibai (strain ATCC 43226 / DSM 21942 / CIP 109018 / JCM 9157 / 1139) TaxID=1236973 RepID=W4QXD5_HALA3|nr:DMT family transporter [Halalkalibacter akibai]GAE36795.1 permease of the drug/metabolite transporter [Halalkalibacter akibai JCM 9157]
MSQTQKGHLFNLLSVLAVAIGPLLAKFGLLQISPAKAAMINALTIIVASFILGLFTKKRVQFYLKKDMIILALFNSLGVIFLFVSMDLLSPVEIGFIGRFYTVFAVLLSVFILKERLSRKEIIFIICAIVGVFLFVEKGGSYQANLVGSFFALLYTFFFALTNVFIKRVLSEERTSNSILFTNSCTTFFFVGVYALLSGELFDGNYSMEGIGYIVVSSLFSGFIGTLFLYEALKYLRFSVANVTRAFSPVLLAIISFPFFPIDLTFQNITGAIVLLISILLLGLADKKSNKEKAEEPN